MAQSMAAANVPHSEQDEHNEPQPSAYAAGNDLDVVRVCSRRGRWTISWTDEHIIQGHFQ